MSQTGSINKKENVKEDTPKIIFVHCCKKIVVLWKIRFSANGIIFSRHQCEPLLVLLAQWCEGMSAVNCCHLYVRHDTSRKLLTLSADRIVCIFSWISLSTPKLSPQFSNPSKNPYYQARETQRLNQKNCQSQQRGLWPVPSSPVDLHWIFATTTA